MSQSPVHFEPSDLAAPLPEQGFHLAIVEAARLRGSQNDNPALHVQVVYRLVQAPPGAQRVVEYFLVEGAIAGALAISRRRLVALYRACGLEPRPGDPIQPEDLVDSELEIRIGHERRCDIFRPCVLGYR
jgi:hypothetical protein